MGFAARSGAYVVSTLDIVGAGRLMWHPEELDDPRIALTVPLVVGSDSAGWPIFPYLLHGRSTHVEMGLLSDAGLTPAEVLTAATLRPATMLGLEAEIGTVEVGKRADLLVVSGDPLEDVGTLGHPVWVIRAGEVRTPQGWMREP